MESQDFLIQKVRKKTSSTIFEYRFKVFDNYEPRNENSALNNLGELKFYVSLKDAFANFFFFNVHELSGCKMDNHVHANMSVKNLSFSFVNEHMIS